jgi:hypothetical protein
VFVGFFASRPAAFESRWPVDESLRRLSAVVEERPGDDHLVGKVTPSEVRLSRWKYGTRQVFRGRLEARPHGAVLTGRFSATTLTRVLWGLLLAASAAWVVYLALDARGIRSLSDAFIWTMPALVILARVLADIFSSAWRAVSDIEFISRIVQRAFSA